MIWTNFATQLCYSNESSKFTTGELKPQEATECPKENPLILI